ncbi:RNA polymerase sigma factor [candidate division KSB1 bacterium]
MVDERDLIEKAQAGDRNAFDRLTEVYMKKAYSIAFRYTGNDGDARDVVQESFYKVYINLHRYNPKFPFSSWFFRILINSSINYSKRERRKRYLFQDRNPKSEINPVDETADTTANPEKQYINKEIQVLLHKGLNGLPEKQRSAIILFDLEGFSQQEVAHILKCPQGSVMSRLFYGRRKLRKFLEKFL